MTAPVVETVSFKPLIIHKKVKRPHSMQDQVNTVKQREKLSKRQTWLTIVKQR
jgi:hypothetical protein